MAATESFVLTENGNKVGIPTRFELCCCCFRWRWFYGFLSFCLWETEHAISPRLWCVSMIHPSDHWSECNFACFACCWEVCLPRSFHFIFSQSSSSINHLVHLSVCGSKIDRMWWFFQVVMSPHDPPQAFVDNFIRLLNDADVSEFQRVLEMKVLSEFWFWSWSSEFILDACFFFFFTSLFFSLPISTVQM